MATTRWILPLLALAWVAGCTSGGGDSDAGAGGAKDGGSGGDGGTGAFEITVLDPDGFGDFPVSVAVSGSKVGAAYFAKLDSPDGGTLQELRYVEAGKAPEKVAVVHNVYGASLAFNAAGEPLIAYLGGGSGGSLYWLESDLALARRGATGAWTSAVVQADSPTMGTVVGLWPSMAVGANDQIFIAFRDIHFGQFPVQDYQHSDVQLATGKPGAFATTTAAAGANTTLGHGGLNALVLTNDVATPNVDQPAIAWSLQPGGSLDTPRDIYFAARAGPCAKDADCVGTTAGRCASNKCTAWGVPLKVQPVGNVNKGVQLAWSKTAGFGMAWEDKNAATLNFTESSDGIDWKAPDPIHGFGTGGWYPSLAFTPDGDPAVSYYVCSVRNGADSCPPDDDELILATRRSGNWIKQTVDSAGGRLSRLGYAGGAAVIVYKDVDFKTLKLARQR
ncbi:MAG: hypothetical protein HY901_06120 [Deltaproteobacteria bacterium]|nr:hypothetical protein [Deltaproteobacteria bacterium]